MGVLEQGLAVLEWTATARPNSKNRALAARTRRLVVKAREAIARLPPAQGSGVDDFLTSVGMVEPIQFPTAEFTLDVPIPPAEWVAPAELDTLMPMPVAPAANDDQFDAWLALLFPGNVGEQAAQEEWVNSGWPA